MYRNQLLRIACVSLVALLALSGCSKEDPEQQAQDYLKRSEAYATQGQYRAAMIEVSNAIKTAPGDVSYQVAMAQIYNTLGAARRASSLLAKYSEDHRQEVALPLAEAYLMQGKFLSARELLTPFEPSMPEETRRKQLYLADSTRIQGNLEQARDQYLDLLEEYPGDTEIQHHLAETYIFMEQPQQAQETMDQALAQAPEDPELLYLDAVLAFRANDLERAEQRLTSALVELPETDIMLPERSAVLKLLSETLTSLGRSTEALVYQRVLAEGASESIEAQRRLSDATLAAEEGEFEEAERILQELLDENPDSQSASVLLGMVNLRQGDLVAAEPLLSGNVDVETANPDLIRATVLAQRQAGKTEQAIKTLERALEVRPKEPVLLAIYGLLALETSDQQEDGYLALQKALAQDPHRGRLRLALARHHFQQGEREQGMAQLRSAFNYQPADWPVTNVYMNQLFARGDLAELAEAVAELKATAPKAPETTLFEAQYRFRNDQQAQAIEQMRRLIQSDAGFARGHGVLAQMLVETDRPKEALEALEQVIALEPNNDSAYKAGVQITAAHDIGVKPVAWLSSLASAYPAATPNATGLQAMVLREQGDLDAAAQLLENYDGEQTNYIRQTKALVYRGMAQASLQQGDTNAARSQLMQALELFPTSKSLSLDLVRLELSANNYQQANTLLEDLRGRYPEDPQLTLVRAQAVAAEKGPAAAYQELRTTWDEQPNPELGNMLITLARAEDPQAVPQLLEEWKAIAPNSRERLLLVAEHHQMQGSTLEARNLYETLLTQNGQDPIALNNLAWLLKDSDLARAAELAKKAVELQPNAPAILDTYGWLLHLQGQSQEAVTYLERAHELAPNAEEIEQNLKTVKESL